MLSKFLAYGADRHGVETVMRLHAVKRWHMIDTTRTQTLAEHSANVALLSMMIARSAPINYFDNCFQVAAAALVHDLPEAFTGDIPSHTKRDLTGLDELEAEVSHPLFDVTVNANSAMLIKICDLADGIRFIRLHGVDLTASHARAGLEQQLMNRFFDAEDTLLWPSNVLSHVFLQVNFYAYEGK